MAEFDPDKFAQIKQQDTPQFDPQKLQKVKDTPPEQSIMDKLLGVGGPRYQLFPERAVRGLGEAIQSFIQAGGAGPPGSREVTEAAVGPSTEVASAFLPIGPEARMATVAKTVEQAPTQESLRSAISKQYSELDKSGVQIPQQEVADFAKQTRQELIRGGKEGAYRPINEPSTFAALDELERTPGSFTDIDSVRRVLGNVRMNVAKNASDAKAAGVVIRKIDDFLSSRAGEVGEKAGAARGNVAALKKSEQITSTAESAELGAATAGSGANLANRLRQNIKWIIDPDYPERKIGFKPDEIELMDAIARGGGRLSAENIARLVSKLGPTHPLSGWGAAIAGGLSGQAWLPLITLAAGHAAQWLSEKLPMSKINRLDEMIRARAPLAQTQPKTTISRPLVGTPQELLMRAGIPMIIDQLGGGQNAPQ